MLTIPQSCVGCKRLTQAEKYSPCVLKGRWYCKTGSLLTAITKAGCKAYEEYIKAKNSRYVRKKRPQKGYVSKRGEIYHLTPEEDRELLELWERGIPVKEIAAHLGCTKNTVYVHIRPHINSRT